MIAGLLQPALSFALLQKLEDPRLVGRVQVREIPLELPEFAV